MDNFNERFETYFSFLDNKVGNDNLRVIIRELDKIFQLGIDGFYSKKDRVKVVKELISYSKNRKDIEEKTIYLLYAYKLNKINNFGLDNAINIVRLSGTLIVEDKPIQIPENVLNVMSDKHRNMCLKDIESMEPDKESLELFNIQLYKSHFEWNKISESLR